MRTFGHIRTTRLRMGARHRAVASLVAALVGALLVPAVVAAGQEMLPICHARGNGTFGPVVVAQPAYQLHLDHGDGEVNGPVPGQPGYEFDEECVPEPAALPLLRVASADESGVEHLVAQWEDTNADGLPSTGDTIRTGEFPLFTDTSGARTYVPATVTEHPNVVLTFLHAGPGWIELDATTASGSFYFYVGPGVEAYLEGSGIFSLVYLVDLTDPAYTEDATQILVGTPPSPPSPSKPAIEPGIHDTRAQSSVDWLQVTLSGTWFVA